MADEYSYPEVLNLSYEQIDAMDIAYHEKQNIRLRKYANEATAMQREALVQIMVDTFTKPGSQPKNARDTVGRWLSPNPGKVRRDFFTAQGSGTTYPRSYDASARYQSGEREGLPQRGHDYGEKNLRPREAMEVRGNFVKGLTNNNPDPPHNGIKVEKNFTELNGRIDKDRLIRYLDPNRARGLWNEDLNLKFKISTSDMSFSVEYIDDSNSSRSPEGMTEEDFDGLE